MYSDVYFQEQPILRCREGTNLSEALITDGWSVCCRSLPAVTDGDRVGRFGSTPLVFHRRAQPRHGDFIIPVDPRLITVQIGKCSDDVGIPAQNCL